MTRFWDRRTDGQTDGVTRLLDLLSPLATQVKITKLVVFVAMKTFLSFNNFFSNLRLMSMVIFVILILLKSRF